MKCPRCDDAALEERERQSITVDLCPQCRGIWLDRGELEKLLSQAERAAADEEAYWGSRERPPERSAPPPPRAYQEPPQHYRPAEYQEHDRGHGYHRADKYGHGPHRKKKHWLDSLGDIFD